LKTQVVEKINLDFHSKSPEYRAKEWRLLSSIPAGYVAKCSAHIHPRPFALSSTTTRPHTSQRVTDLTAKAGVCIVCNDCKKIFESRNFRICSITMPL